MIVTGEVIGYMCRIHQESTCDDQIIKEGSLKALQEKT